MRTMMGILKDRHGTYYARKRVPKELQEAAARILGNGKVKQAWLKRSLGTKKLSEANIRAKPVLMEFDGILSRAADALKARPVRRSLSDAEIRRMGEYSYATSLAAHDQFMLEAPEEEADARRLYETDYGPQEWADEIPKFGLSEGQLFEIRDVEPGLIAEAEAALGRGDIEYMSHKIEDALEAFQINLDHGSQDFRKLGMEILRQHVLSIRARAARHRGEPVPTPPLILPASSVPPTSSGETLANALEGWRKERNPSIGVFREYERAVRLFTELHGALTVWKITRTHVREFREKLQELPRHRVAALRTATLPELVEWSRSHPSAPRITNTTVSKLLGGVQTVALWAYDRGMIPEGQPWSDPFARMRLQRDDTDREPFTIAELNKLFASPVFSEGARPKPGAGEAAYWMPIVALFTGARRGEIAALTALDVGSVDDVPAFSFVRDVEAGKSLKTRSSARTVPVHPSLIVLGWLEYVDSVRQAGGEKAWLFSALAPSEPARLKSWTKWFHRYLRANGVTDTRKVFHSFRHTFKDALRAARTPEDLGDALTGHSNATVGRSYGAKHIVRRYGMQTLRDAVDGVEYKGLALPKPPTAKPREMRPRTAGR